MGGGGGGGGGLFERARHVITLSACITTCILILLRRVLISNPLGFLTDIVAEAYDLACVVDVQHWWSFSRRLPFLGRPTGRFAVVSTRSRSLGKNDEARSSSLLMALKNRVTLAIALMRLCTTRLRACTYDRSTESSSNYLGAILN